MSTGTDTQLSTDSNADNKIAVVALSENKVFIVHGVNYYLYGLVCVIEQNAITIGIDTRLSSKSNSGARFSAVTLNENKVCICHGYGGTSTNTTKDLGVIVCTIEGTTVTSGLSTILATHETSGYSTAIAKLDENKILVTHGDGYSSGYYTLYGIVCTIEGTTVKKGSSTLLVNDRYAGEVMSIAVLGQDKVLVAHSHESDNDLYGIVCTISGTTITKGTDTKIQAYTKDGTSISAVTLNENKVFIAHNAGIGSSRLYGTVCTISGTTITIGTNTRLSTGEYSSRMLSTLLLAENKVLIIHTCSSNYYIYGIIVTINKDIITFGEDMQLNVSEKTGYRTSAVALNKNKIFIVHNDTNDGYPYGQLAFLEKAVKTEIFSIDDIYGIAKANATEGQQVDIYRPYEEVAV